MIWGFDSEPQVWRPKVARTFRASVNGSVLTIASELISWSKSLRTPERALAARNFIRQHGVLCSGQAVKNLLANF